MREVVKALASNMYDLDICQAGIMRERYHRHSWNIGTDDATPRSPEIDPSLNEGDTFSHWLA